MIPQASALNAKDNKKGQVARGGPSVPVIPATTPSGPGTMIIGGGRGAPVIPVTFPLKPGTMTIGGGPECATNPPGQEACDWPGNSGDRDSHIQCCFAGPWNHNRTVANSPAGSIAPSNAGMTGSPGGAAVLPGGSLHGRLRGPGATPLSAVRVEPNRIPPAPRRVGWMEPGQRAVGGFTPPAEEIRANAMIGYPTTDSTFWPDSSGCVWRRILVIHRATGAFAILYSRVVKEP